MNGPELAQAGRVTQAATSLAMTSGSEVWGALGMSMPSRLSLPQLYGKDLALSKGGDRRV
jgi:hypothetical protein